MTQPFIILIAGPNGVGKSTFALRYLEDHPDCELIVDPDAIARGLSIPDGPQRNIAAGRIALESIDSLIDAGRCFAIETTLSGKTLATKLMRAHQNGYTIRICLLVVPSIIVSMQRVEARATLGGHDIPMLDQMRRFERSYRNFHDTYSQVCHEWFLYNALFNPPEFISKGGGGFSQE